MAQDGELVHHHIQHPVQAVLDAPMLAHDAVEAFGRERGAEQVVSALTGCLAIGLAAGGDGIVRLTRVDLQSAHRSEY